MAKLLQLGENKSDRFSIPVSIPIVFPPKVTFSVIDLKHFEINNPGIGVEVSEEQFSIMQAETDIDDLVSAGIVLIEEV